MIEYLLNNIYRMVEMRIVAIDKVDE